jgi:hypothetical protein
MDARALLPFRHFLTKKGSKTRRFLGGLAAMGKRCGAMPIFAQQALKASMLSTPISRPSRSCPSYSPNHCQISSEVFYIVDDVCSIHQDLLIHQPSCRYFLIAPSSRALLDCVANGRTGSTASPQLIVTIARK